MNDELLDTHGKPVNRLAMMLVMLIGVFSVMLMQTALGTALPALMKAFDVNAATVQWLTTIFLMANGIMVPVSAFLTTRIPTKTLYLSALGLFTIGTLVAFMTPTTMFWLLMVARVLQAMAVGILMPLMQVVSLSLFDAQSRGKAMGMGGLVIGMAPAIGPTLSGWILEKDHTLLGLTLQNSWRSIFGIVLPVVIVVMIASFFLFHDILPVQKVTLDIRSLMESTFGFGLVLYGFAMVASDGWGSFNVIVPLIVGIIIVIEFMWHQSRMEKPFLDMSVFKSRQFTITTILVSLVMMAMIGVEMVLPIYMQNIRGLSPLNSGLTLLPGALMMGIISPIAGAFYDKHGAKRLAVTGFTILIIGTIPLFYMTAETPTLYITSLYTLRMFGIAMTMMPLTASAMGALSPKTAAQGTAANNTMRQIAASLGTAVLASVMQSVTKNNMPKKSLNGQDPLAYGRKALDATLGGFHASFLLAASFAVVALLITFLLHSGKVNTPNQGGDVR
ncbi:MULTISPECIES: MDR family MFS transporter [Leuconostoc]|uniref:Drug:H+ antiporter-2 (DHA2) family protein n=2 Tax=Leuconostoc kimchii TaxID=136609 RepID=D5T3H3_LEUKI|nr:MULTISPECIES: MDR family MFS transporter [Leuconostoc]ADG40822.1 drug:H+ antiporter-2 (DHA2) family protein [Leuconostoc kimchii IMSNU 11154]AEJ31202.1 drug:H+ antiporter-2 (DHA2) family protein [Leuconostoc sp. C2]QBR48289.1 DHA2 family efflux MFS transporter permease subunit [Leuconostoc kimchii]